MYRGSAMYSPCVNKNNIKMILLLLENIQRNKGNINNTTVLVK